MVIATHNDWIEECDHLVGWEQTLWDARLSVGTIATFAALLAGFSLSGLLWMAASPARQRARRSRGVLGVWASLPALTLATLQYAEIAGLSSCEQGIFGTMFPALLVTMGTVTLFVSLSTLLMGLFTAEIDRLSSLIIWAAVIVGTFSIYEGNSRHIGMITGTHWMTTLPGVTQAVLILASLVVGGVWRQNRDQLGAVVVVLVAAGTMILFHLALNQGDASWAPEAVGWYRLVAWSVFAILILGRANINTNQRQRSEERD